MGKHKDHQHEGGVAVEEEQPKSQKVGDKEEGSVTAVDAKEKKARKAVPKNSTYRILEGVDAAKFAGQRGHVIRSLQKLSQQDPDGTHSLESIVNNVEGLSSKTPVEASVLFHLKAMAKDGQVEVKSEPKAEKAVEVAA